MELELEVAERKTFRQGQNLKENQLYWDEKSRNG
jgi:hypothetical protein